METNSYIIRNGLLFLILLGMQDSYGQQNIVCTFDNDAEGWTVAGNDGVGNFGKIPGPEFFSYGGNPTGHIQIEDNIAGAYYAVAPAKYTGNLLSYNEGSISFDARAVSGELTTATERAEFGTVTIQSPYGTAKLDITSAMPVATYTLFSASLTYADWGKTESEWQQILSNVTSITILLEYSIASIGDDRIAIDNFIVGPPEICTASSCEKNKVKMCHVPPGNPSEANTICISESAVNAHLDHGDYCGPCLEIASSNLSGISDPVEDYIFGDITVYPNPFKNKLNIDLGEIEGGYYGNVEIFVYDYLGQEVKHISDINERETELDMSTFEKGMYMYKLLKDKTLIQAGTVIKKEE